MKLLRRIWLKLYMKLLSSEHEKYLWTKAPTYLNKIKCSRSHIKFIELDLQLPLSGYLWMIDAYPYISSLLEFYPNLTVTFNETQVKVEINGLMFYIESRSEWFILKEIFVDGLYNFTTTDKVIVIDIGMNVGLASIFLAAKPEIKQVYAFEPVDDTFEQARRNIELNDTIANKIVPINYGLSNKNKTERFKYDPNNKGSFGYVGNKKFTSDQLEYKEVSLRSVNEVIEPLVSEEIYIVKMDCEGAEYEMLPELMKLSNLPEMLMIEWHFSNGSELIKLLKNYGYSLIMLTTEPTAGMIYAYQKRINT